jgi:single-strand DNA-binding protein
VFGKQAELIQQYMKKGSSIFVEGRIENRSWDSKDGEKKYRTEVIVENFQFGPKGGSSAGGASSGSYAPKSSSSKSEDKDLGAEIQYPEEEINIEDIPF